MSYTEKFSSAPVESIEAALCNRLESIRLAKNITQQQLADNAGVSRRTISRMENGEGISLDTLIRVMRALDLANHLEMLLPDPDIRPIDRVKSKTKKRQRASGSRRQPSMVKEDWKWGDE